MITRPARLLLASAAVLATTSVTAAVPAAAYDPPTALMGDGGSVIPLKNAAMIVRTEGGYRYIAGQQDTDLTVTVTADGKLRFEDVGTAELRDIPRPCRREAVGTGIAAVCNIPLRYGPDNEMYVEVWPRLGDDSVDGSTLSSMFRLWVLADAGVDTVRGGAGDDFVNGAHDKDKVWGGAGDDWIRTGTGDDEIWGEAGNDHLVGAPDADVIDGGEGNDRTYGGTGTDEVSGGAGVDVVNCGDGLDGARADSADRFRSCELRFS